MLIHFLFEIRCGQLNPNLYLIERFKNKLRNFNLTKKRNKVKIKYFKLEAFRLVKKLKLTKLLLLHF